MQHLPQHADHGGGPHRRVSLHIRIRIGSAWQATSQAGNDYLSVAINFGTGEIRANAVKTENDGEYRFIPYSN